MEAGVLRVLSNRILETRKVAYAVTDMDLMLLELGGRLSIFHDQAGIDQAQSIYDLVPEMQGQDDIFVSMLEGELDAFELPLINRTTVMGETAYLTVTFLPHYDQRNNINGLVLLADDTTEIGQAEQKLTEQRNELALLKDRLARQNTTLEMANIELKRLDNLRSRFVSVAAHELRTPLASIFGYLEVLLDGDLGEIPDNQSEYLEIMQEGASRLLRITNNLLDITRIEAERIELLLEPVEIPLLLQKVIKELQPQLTAKQQTLTVDVEPNLPHGLCDSVRIIQVMNNLLSNANKYTPDQGTINVHLAQADVEGFIRLSVADNGPGISAADQEKLFTAFYRAESVANSHESGAGLGLYIVQSLVDLHGGKVWLDSVLGQGTTFYVTLPVTGK